jgi:hypothetical protein
VGLSVLLWLPRLRGPIDLRYDAGVYFLQGTALAEGKGYRLLNEPGEIQAVQYPPLLSALVAAHQLVLGTRDPAVVGRWLRGTYFIIFTLYVVAVYALGRSYLKPLHAFLAGLICALSLQTIFLSDLLFAEIPFALTSTLFALLNRKSARAPYFLLTALAGAAAYLLRTAGLALLVAWVGEAVFKRDWKQAAGRLAVSLVPVLAWQGYLRSVTSGAEYQHPAYAYQRAPYQYYNVSYGENAWLVDPFMPERGRLTAGELAERVADNLAVMPTSLGEAVTARKEFWKGSLEAVRARLGAAPPLWVVLIPATVLGGLIVAGAVIFLCRREAFIPLYVAASVGLICLTPWPGQFVRYAVPLTPFLALCLLRCLSAFGEFARRRWAARGPAAAGAAFALALAVVFGVDGVTVVHAYLFRHEPVYSPPGVGGARLFYYDQKWAAFDAALAWLRGRAGPDDILATVAPHWAYLQTDRKAVMMPMEVDPARAQRLLEDVPVTYLIVDNLEFLDVARRYAEPVVRTHPQRWRLVYGTPDSNTRVYRLVP